ncbi:MAG: SMC family ATPase [Candidatus Micrarchaeota archaeon]|nr:SMC family ATPase [Candidatus Micrarchaeota archaeon]
MVLIRSVRLQNWRSHRDTRLEFSKGTNMLVGIMGAGKSSVLEAICFALYGTFPALSRRKVKLSQIVSAAAPSLPSIVEVEFEQGGKAYSVKRAIKDGKGDAELREGQRLIEAKPDAVTRMVQEITGLDYDLFTKAIYSEQNSLDYFLSLNPVDRKRQIDELMGIDRFELARTNASKLSNRLAREADEKLRKVSLQDKESLVSQLSEAAAQAAQAESELAALKKEHASAAAELSQLKAQLSKYEQIKSKADSLQRKISECDAFISEMSPRVKPYSQSDFEALSSVLKSQESQYSSLQVQSRSLEEKISALSRELGEVQGSLASLSNKMAECDALKQRLERLTKELEGKSIESLRTELESLGTQLLDSEKAYSSLKSELSLLRDECLRLGSELEQQAALEREYSSLRGITQRDLDEKKGNEAALVEWIASLKEIIRTSEESIVHLSREEGSSVCPLCDSPLTGERKAQLVRSKNEAIEGSRQGLAEGEAKLAELRKSIREMEAKLSRKAELSAKLESYAKVRDELARKSARASELSAQALPIEQKLAGLRAAHSKLQALMRVAEEHARISQQVSEADSARKQALQLEPRRQELQKSLTALESELSKVRAQYSSVEKALSEAREQARTVKLDLELQESLAQKRRERERLAGELSGLSYSEQEHNSLRSRATELTGKASELGAKVQGVERQAALLRSNHQLLRQKLDEIERQEAEAAAVQEAARSLEAFHKSVSETQLVLRTELINSVNAVISRVWPLLYPYGDFTKVRLDATESDYVLMAERMGQWVAVEGNVSGGERASMALALRIALSIVLAPNAGTIVLDEPTHNLDEKGVHSLSEVLRERLPKIIPQAFVITHDEGLKEGASGRLYVFQRDKSKHGPTIVISDLA